MSPDLPLRGLADELTGRSDEALVELLNSRPDLASPPPRGTDVLATRALRPPSISLAGEGLDLLSVAVVEAFLDAAEEHPPHNDLLGPVGREDILARLGRRARRADVDDRLDRLVAIGLVWGTGPTTRSRHRHWIGGVHLSAALPWRARHLLSPLASMSEPQIEALVASVDERPRELLLTLAQGPALGRSRDAAVDADPAAPVPVLLKLGLLERVDNQTVELPPQVGQLLRGEPALPTASLREPAVTAGDGPGRFDAASIDAAGAGEALELLRHADDLIDALGEAPASILRSGGIGIRELRRLAKTTGLSVTRVGLLVEVLSRCWLVDAGAPDGVDDDTGAPAYGREDIFAPTGAVDAWAHQHPQNRWFDLADAWLGLPRRPWMIGDTDADGTTLAALSAGLYDAAAARHRRAILDPMLDAEPAHPVDIDALVGAIGWRHPRLLRQMTRHVVSETLREATEVGLVAHGSLTAAGRALLAAGPDEDSSTDDSSAGDAHAAVVTAMVAALPEPIDHFLVQADSTVMVPGPLRPATADHLRLLADLESGGAASVYRITDDSLRRALDTGRSSTEIIGFLTEHSRTPVPQSLHYLVDDVARRHGRLRVGMASSFIRCNDTATLAEVLRSEVATTLALRALAPTVAVSGASFRDVVEGLRAAGFAPAGEDSAGALIDLRGRGVRVATRSRSARDRFARPAFGQARSIVTRMRAADRAAAPVGAGSAAGGGETVSALIQLALRTGRRLRLNYVDAHGSASLHVVHARSLGAGHLVADDPGGDTDLVFPLHRINRVEVL